MDVYQTHSGWRLFTFALLSILFTEVYSDATSTEALWEQARTDTTALGKLLALTDSLLDAQPQKGNEYLERLEPLVHHCSDQYYLARWHFLKGYYFKNMGVYQQAFQEYIRCSRLASKLGRTSLYIKSENNIATIYAQLQNYTKSTHQYQKLLPQALKYGDPHLILMIYTNLANNLLSQQKFDSAQYYYEQAYRYTEPGTFQRAAVEVNLANLCVKTGKYKQARQYAFSSARFAKKNRIWELYLESMLNVINSYIREEKFPLAIRYSLLALPVAKKHQLRLQLHNIYGNLASCYQGMGHFRKAYEYQVKFTELRDSLFNETMSRQINEMNAKYETEKKEKEILLQKSELRRKALIIRFLTVGSFLVILFLLTIGWFYMQQKRAYRMLVQKHLELTQNGSSRFKKKQNGKPVHSSLPFTRGKLREILNQMENLLESEKMFMQSDITIEKLSNRLNIHSRYLSQIINETYGMNFPNFINKLRVQEAVRMFSDDQYQHYSIEGICREVGFQSKSSFNAAFKKFTGVTPGYFRKQMKQFEKAALHKTA